MCKSQPCFDETGCYELRRVHSKDTKQHCYRIGIPVLTGMVWRWRGWVRWSIFLHTLSHTTCCLPAYSKSVCALTHRAKLPQRLTTRNSLSCSVSKLSGCAVWHSDRLVGKLISQQPLVLAETLQHTAGRRPGSGQPEKETPAAYSSVGRGAALLDGGGRGKVRHLVSESFD